MRKVLLGIIVIIVMPILLLLAVAWEDLGTVPSGTLAKSIEISKNYDTSTKRFVNRRQVEYDQMIKSFDYFKLVQAQILGQEMRAPLRPFPQVKPDVDNLLSAESLQYIWLGHSTILARLEQQTILLDPVFSNAAPLPFAVPRFQAPALSLNDLPDIDLILISHDHYDHLERKTIEFFLNKKTHFIVPLGVSSHLIGWGIEANRITELDWWDATDFQDLNIVCTPSQHFSGRTGPNGNQTLWASWAVLGQQERFYFSGDSGYDSHFLEIGAQYGPFDIAFLESGQYNSIWPMSHMFPEETMQAGKDLRANIVQPIHWGMFTLSTHDWFEPATAAIKNGKALAISIIIPQIGTIVEPRNPPPIKRWWEQ